MERDIAQSILSQIDDTGVFEDSQEFLFAQ